jgi:hypothetical protein
MIAAIASWKRRAVGSAPPHVVVDLGRGHGGAHGVGGLGDRVGPQVHHHLVGRHPSWWLVLCATQLQHCTGTAAATEYQDE